MAINLGKVPISTEMKRLLSTPQGVYYTLEKIKDSIEKVRDNQNCLPKQGPDDLDEPLDEAVDAIENGLQVAMNILELQRMNDQRRIV